MKPFPSHSLISSSVHTLQPGLGIRYAVHDPDMFAAISLAMLVRTVVAVTVAITGFYGELPL